MTPQVAFFELEYTFLFSFNILLAINPILNPKMPRIIAARKNVTENIAIPANANIKPATKLIDENSPSV